MPSRECRKRFAWQEFNHRTIAIDGNIPELYKPGEESVVNRRVRRGRPHAAACKGASVEVSFFRFVSKAHGEVAYALCFENTGSSGECENGARRQKDAVGLLGLQTDESALRQIFDSNFDLRIFNEFSLMDNTVCFNFHGNGKRHTREGMGLDLFDSNGH